MKTIKNNSTLFLFSLFLIVAIGFSACEKDEVIVPKTLDQYVSELSSLISSEKEIVNNMTRGYNVGQMHPDEYTFDSLVSNYLDSLTVAEEILAMPDVTIEDVYHANYIISVPGYNFNTHIFNSDRRPLDAKIIECEGMRDTIDVGIYYGQCPYEADSIFGDAINWASNWRSSSITLDRQVPIEVDSLERAFTVYKSQIIGLGL